MIRRAPRPDDHYTVIRNAVLRDDRLSYRARGILAAILSRPDNWKISRDALAREGREGRDAVNTALNELVDAGYIQRTRIQQDDGTWITEQTVFDTPGNWESADSGPVSAGFQSPKPGKPTTGNPTVGKPGGNRKTVKNQREEENIRSTVVDPVFDTFWHNYPRKVGRKKALQWWQRHGNNEILDSLDAWRQYWVQEGTDMRYIPHPYTWLNQERWRDPAPEPAVNVRTDTVLAVLNDIMGDQLDVAQHIMESDTQPELEAPNDPF